MSAAPNATIPQRPASTDGFETAIFCALGLEGNAVVALFDQRWDNDGFPYEKHRGDRNAYTVGAIGRHCVVLVHMPGMGKVNAAAVANCCRMTFHNVKLALVVGVCGAVPFFGEGREIVLGDIIISSALVQYDLGKSLPDRFERKDALLDTLGRPDPEIRAFLEKIQTTDARKEMQAKISEYIEVLQDEPELRAAYPGTTTDILFEASYRHPNKDMSCDECGCNGQPVPRSRLEQIAPQPAVYVGFMASGDTVMKNGEHRDDVAKQTEAIAFEMEGAGIWDTFPCVLVIKAACDYADSHKNKIWQPYAAASAAACMKALLGQWAPSIPKTGHRTYDPMPSKTGKPGDHDFYQDPAS
jgi:nucleoside phosphorylase